MKLVIVGGGASGLMLASLLNNNKNYEITILEKLEHVGKKLLLTGNGKCNLTNTNLDCNCYNNDFAYDIAKSFDTISYFNSIGLLTKVDDQGRVYPISNVSNSVVDVLRESLTNVNIINNEEVIDIKHIDNKYELLTATYNRYEADIVVIATGGKTYYKDTNSYNLASKLKHMVSQLRPTLTYIKVANNLASIENIRANVHARLLDNNKVVYEDDGEVLFKKGYLSGIVMFQLSSYLARHPYGNYKVSLDLLPNMSIEEVRDYINKYPSLTGLFPKMITMYLKKLNGDLAYNIKNFTFDVVDNIDFKNAQVTCGGIVTDELTNSLESKNNKNLYFAGEIIDGDGICGGYNLQFAFACAHAIYKELNNEK